MSEKTFFEKNNAVTDLQEKAFGDFLSRHFLYGTRNFTVEQLKEKMFEYFKQTKDVKNSQKRFIRTFGLFKKWLLKECNDWRDREEAESFLSAISTAIAERDPKRCIEHFGPRIRFVDLKEPEE